MPGHRLRVVDRVDLARFEQAVREGLKPRALGERFGIDATTAAEWRKRVLAKEERRDA